MRILDIIFFRKNSPKKSPVDVQSKTHEILLGIDKSAKTVHNKATDVTSEYLEARKQAKQIQESSKKLIVHLDTLYAIALATDGVKRIKK